MSRRRVVAGVAGGLLAVALLASGCTSGSRPTAARATASSAPRPSGSVTARPSPPPRLRVSLLPEHLPHPLAREALSPTGDPWRAVVAGGLVAGDASSAATYRLDLHTGATRPLPALTTPVHDTAGTTAAGATCVLGGGGATEQSVVQLRRAGAWRVAGRLPSPRSDLTAVASHGVTYVVGGYDGRTPALAGVLASSDCRHWREVARLAVPVRYAPVAVVGRDLWVFGGEVSGTMVRAVQRIDLRTGRTRVVARLPGPSGHGVAVPLGDRLLLVGGRDAAGAPTARMWWFRPGTARFTPAGRLPTPLSDSAVVRRGRTAYLVGGERPALSDRTLRVTWR